MVLVLATAAVKIVSVLVPALTHVFVGAGEGVLGLEERSGSHLMGGRRGVHSQSVSLRTLELFTVHSLTGS